MVRSLTLCTLVTLAACGGGSRDVTMADSLSRDLQRVPMDSSAPLDDRPAAAQPAPRPATPQKPAARRPAAPKPTAPKPAAPKPAAAELAAGTTIPTSIDAEINSRHNKAGETVTATVASDVKDGRGRTVIPAGSRVTIRIDALHESENKGDKTGKLELAASEVAIGGRTYALDASAEALERKLVDRKTNAGDVAKVGAGTAAGALVGRVIGGSTKGAVIGGAIGAAVGTQRAIETQDRDVVVPAGSRVVLTLRETFRQAS